MKIIFYFFKFIIGKERKWTLKPIARNTINIAIYELKQLRKSKMSRRLKASNCPLRILF